MLLYCSLHPARTLTSGSCALLRIRCHKIQIEVNVTKRALTLQAQMSPKLPLKPILQLSVDTPSTSQIAYPSISLPATCMETLTCGSCAALFRIRWRKIYASVNKNKSQHSLTQTCGGSELSGIECRRLLASSSVRRRRRIDRRISPPCNLREESTKTPESQIYTPCNLREENPKTPETQS